MDKQGINWTTLLKMECYKRGIKMKTIEEIKAEYKANNTYTKDIANHGKAQRQLPEIKVIDEQLKRLGYELDDSFFHRLAILDGEVVRIIDSARGLKIVTLNTDDEYIASYVKEYKYIKEIAKLVANNTTDNYAPKIKIKRNRLK